MVCESLLNLRMVILQMYKTLLDVHESLQNLPVLLSQAPHELINISVIELVCSALSLRKNTVPGLSLRNTEDHGHRKQVKRQKRSFSDVSVCIKLELRTCLCKGVSNLFLLVNLCNFVASKAGVRLKCKLLNFG